MSKRKITVLVCEDNALMMRGLQCLLEQYEDIEIAGMARNGAEAVEKARELQPEVILMDLSMPELDGASATKIIKAERPFIRVVVVSAAQDEKLLKDAVDAGADGFYPKPVMSGEGLYLAIIKSLDPVKSPY